MSIATPPSASVPLLDEFPRHLRVATPLIARPAVFPGHPLVDDLGLRDPRWEDIETHVLDVQGTSVFARRHVARSARPGTPHLLLHGLGASANVWLDAIPLLAEAGEVVAVDLPGFGRTRPPAATAARVKHLVAFVVALLDELGWDRVVLHGSSMGGLVAGLVAAEHPGRVERVALVAPALAPPTRRVRETSGLCYARFVPFLVPGLGTGILRLAWLRGDPARNHDQLTRAVFGDPTRLRASVRELGIENVVLVRSSPWRIPSFAEAADSISRSWLRAATTWSRMLAIRVPTLVVWGDADGLIHPTVVDGLEHGLADATVHRFAGCGHTPMQELPERYTDAVLGWLG